MTLQTHLIELFVMGAFVLSVVASIPAFLTTARLKKRYGAVTWKTVPAVVESSSVKRSHLAGGAYYEPDIQYRYEFHGTEYVSSILSPETHSSGSRNRSWAERWVATLPVGTSVTAFVDPLNPTVAVLHPEFRYGWLFTFGCLLAVYGFFCVGLILVYWIIRYV